MIAYTIPPDSITGRMYRVELADWGRFVVEADAALEGTDPAAVAEVYRNLRAWHDKYHSPNRPPRLNCTGCKVWPVVARLAERLGFDPLDPPAEWRA